MLKNLTQNQILLTGMATVLLILAALSFYLLQNPSAPLPFAPQPSSTATPVVLSPSDTIEPSPTNTPTRQTSYTPFATHATAVPGTATGTLIITPTITSITTGTPSPILPSITPPRLPAATATQVNTPLPGTPTLTYTPITSTPTFTLTPAPVTATLSPTPSATLVSGEYEVTGRIVQNGTPVPNVIVWFEDDVPARQSTTDSGGHYSFITLAPGTHFTLTFDQSDNPQLTPASEVTSLARVEGTLPTGVNTIQIPDFEISLNLNAMLFQLLSPVDGATYSAAYIGSSNPIQFIWTLYSQGGSYHVELGPNGSDVPGYTSNQLASTNYMWNGTLDNGTHITEGAYWWRVAVTDSLGTYVLDLYTQPFDIVFNP